jgi:hypothetical protein
MGDGLIQHVAVANGQFFSQRRVLPERRLVACRGGHIGQRGADIVISQPRGTGSPGQFQVVYDEGELALPCQGFAQSVVAG